MAKTIVGLYDHIGQARATVEQLVDAGFDRDAISLVANATAKEYGRYFDEQGRYRSGNFDDELTSGEGAAAGAGIGAAIGGLGGLLMGLGLLAVPGVGPALAAGPIVSALVGAGIGAAAGGLMGALVNSGVPEEEAGYYAEGVRRGGSLVMLTVAEERVDEAERIMNDHDPVDIDERVAHWKDDGFESYDRDAAPFTTEQIAAERERYQVPVVEEELKIGKREVGAGGVRVRSYVRETPVAEDVTLREETVRVERRDADRAVTDADGAFEDRTIEMTGSREEAVIEKEARVTGEVVIEKDVKQRTETVTDTVRSTEVDVEQVGDARAGIVDVDSSVRQSRFDSDPEEFRNHYHSNFSDSGRDYHAFEPAYRFGSRAAREDGYEARAWTEVEPELRRRWEARNPSSWNDFREAIRYSFESERTRV